MQAFTKTAVVLGALLLALPILAGDQVDADKAADQTAVFGYDTFDDIRLAIHHQSGTDAAVYSTDLIADADADDSPFLGQVAWGPWGPWGPGWLVADADLSQAETESFYVNDDWQMDGRWSFEVDEKAPEATVAGDAE